MKQILEGVRVVDFSWIYTGPITTKFLGDNGAEVIKIESGTRSDVSRTIYPYRGGAGTNRSTLFANYNSSKLGMVVDLKDPRGVDLVKRLVGTADVVLETFGPGVISRMGLGYDELKKANPSIIMASMTMYGQYGPYAQHPTVGQYFQAAVGFVDLLGWPDRAPCIPPIPYTDFIAPWCVLMAILSALDYRHRTGKGQYLDVSMLEGSMHFLSPAVMDYMVNDRIQTRRGNRRDGAAPHGVFPCKGTEGWCAIAVFNDNEWQALCHAMGDPGWAGSPKFSTALARERNQDELEQLVGRWTASQTAEEVVTVLQAAGVKAGIVETGEDLVDKDPQLKHRQAFTTLNHPEIGPHIVERPSFRFSKTPSEPQRPAPCLGEHTEYVCREMLGLGDDEFLKLLEDHVIGYVP